MALRILIIGYGKMGRKIEELATQQGCTISHIVEKDIHLNWEDLAHQVDAAIEFTNPESAYHNISHCIRHGIPVVSGTTGWLDRYQDVLNLVRRHHGAFFYASNFSIGVNLFFAINEKLAHLMNSFSEYNPSIEETHHIHKKDAPSGTAITTAEGIIDHSTKMTGWHLRDDKTGEQKDKISITAIRQGEVYGDHSVFYRSDIDTITLTHQAHSREGFALGAIKAAQWLQNRHGSFGMKDMLGI